MKDIPGLIKILIISIFLNLIFVVISFVVGYEQTINSLKVILKTLPISPQAFAIIVVSIIGIIQSLIALGLYLRFNWVRIIYLFFIIIGLPFTIMESLKLSLNLKAIHQIFSLFISFFTIYVLLIHPSKKWYIKDGEK